MALLTDDELASMRDTVTATFDTPVSLQRSVAGVYTDVLTTTCANFSLTSTVSLPGLPSYLQPTAWEFTLAWDADVRTGDRLVTPAGTFLVYRAVTDASYNTQDTAYAYQLLDASGDSSSFSLLLNGTVDVTRQDGTAVYTARRVRLDWPPTLEGIRPAGQPVQGVLYDTPDATYRRGDTVTVTQQDGHSGPPAVSRYTVGLVEQLSDGVAQLRVQLTGTGR